MPYWKNGESAENRGSDAPPPSRFRPSNTTSASDDDHYGRLSSLSLHDMLRAQKPATRSDISKEAPQDGVFKQNGRTARTKLMRRPVPIPVEGGKTVSFARKVSGRRIKTIVIPIPQARARRARDRGFLQVPRRSSGLRHTGSDGIFGKDSELAHITILQSVTR
jgi:hypothetical protein